MRRFVDPAIVALAIALIVSVGLHIPAYGVLGVLADRLLSTGARPSAPTTVELTVGDASGEAGEEAPQAERAGESADPERADRAQPDPRREREQPEKRERQARAPDKKEKPQEQKKEREQVQVQQARAEPVNKLSVKQHSRDPDVKKPENARFLARENNRVDEETVARLRNDVRDDAEPSPGPRHEAAASPEEVGSSDETDVAQMRDMEGSDARRPTPEETEERRPEKVAEVEPQPRPSGSPESPSRQRDGPGAPGPAGSAGAARSAATAQEGQRAAPSGRQDAIVIDDGFGTLRIPREQAGIEGAAGGDGDASSARDRRRARQARTGRRGSGGEGGRRGTLGPNRRFAWSELQEMYGEERLDRERQAYIEERKSARRGSNRQKEWKKFRAAIENFVPNVKPGNQTALNAAASPFADYISEVHRRIHREFSGKFLRSLPTWSASPFSDQSLKTQLEIILNRDGTVHRIGVVASSGFLPFDYGAFASVMRGQPYPEPPLAILSGDGRVYLHWGFYRNQRQCGTFNAEPYILPHPPGTPEGGGGPLQDEPEWGGVVPEGSEPTWGEEQEGQPEGGGSEENEQRTPAPDGDDPGGDREGPSDGHPPPRRPHVGGSAMG